MLSCVALLCIATGCTSIEDKRIRQLQIDKGFGTRATGRADLENYVTGGDSIVFVVDTQAYTKLGADQLYLLTQPQRPSIDGTILIPYIGPIDVLGMTERELTALVREQLATVFTFPIEMHARIVDDGKAVFVYGEIDGPNYVKLTKADVTLIELLARSEPTSLANWGRIRLVRPDAENPLTMTINVREMLYHGFTNYNVKLENNDIIYVPPTFLGHISRIIEKLLEPLGVAVRSLFGAASLRSSYDVVTGDSNASFFPNNGFRF